MPERLNRDSDALLLEKLLVPPRELQEGPPAVTEPRLPYGTTPMLDRLRLALPDLNAAVKHPDVLLSQLLALDPDSRAEAVLERPSLRMPVFLRFVRETALSALPQQPDLTEVLALLAVQQAEATLDVDVARCHLGAAYCLLSSLERLRRRRKQAEFLLNRAAFLLDGVDEQALFFRTLALLRWEQGRPAEAQSLLARVVQLRRGTAETAPCQLLLGLLHFLEGVAVNRPRALLRHALTGLDAAHHPFLSLLARLGLAYGVALEGDLEAASTLRDEAQLLFPLLTAETAIAVAGWLDARVSVLTSREGGLERLLLARQQLLLRDLPFAGTLATVDAVHFLALSGERHLIQPFLKDAPLPLALPPAIYLCEDLEALPQEAGIPTAKLQARVKRQVLALPTTLRRVCLLRGIPTEPLPFV